MKAGRQKRKLMHPAGKQLLLKWAKHSKQAA
jgi:hypothetical protein